MILSNTTYLDNVLEEPCRQAHFADVCIIDVKLARDCGSTMYIISVVFQFAFTQYKSNGPLFLLVSFLKVLNMLTYFMHIHEIAENWMCDRSKKTLI